LIQQTNRSVFPLDGGHHRLVLQFRIEKDLSPLQVSKYFAHHDDRMGGGQEKDRLDGTNVRETGIGVDLSGNAV
jgi:hypothetical protein